MPPGRVRHVATKAGEDPNTTLLRGGLHLLWQTVRHDRDVSCRLTVRVMVAVHPSQRSKRHGASPKRERLTRLPAGAHARSLGDMWPLRCCCFASVRRSHLCCSPCHPLPPYSSCITLATWTTTATATCTSPASWSSQLDRKRSVPRHHLWLVACEGNVPKLYCPAKVTK